MNLRRILAELYIAHKMTCRDNVKQILVDCCLLESDDCEKTSSDPHQDRPTLTVLYERLGSKSIRKVLNGCGLVLKRLAIDQEVLSSNPTHDRH